MNKFLIALIFSIFCGAAQAQSALPQGHINSMACLENMGNNTTWNQCLALIFAPCLEDEVGSEAHVSCLELQRVEWTGSMRLLQSDVTDAITLKSAEDLAKILSGWINYVSQKCQAGEGSMDNPLVAAKQLGCQITELAGLTGEYAACLEGRSTAEYCVVKD